MTTTYEVTYTLICNEDGLVSHQIKSIKEVFPIEEEDE